MYLKIHVLYYYRCPATCSFDILDLEFPSGTFVFHRDQRNIMCPMKSFLPFKMHCLGTSPPWKWETIGPILTRACAGRTCIHWYMLLQKLHKGLHSSTRPKCTSPNAAMQWSLPAGAGGHWEVHQSRFVQQGQGEGGTGQ